MIFILLIAVLIEILSVIVTFKNEHTKQLWRKNRLIVHAIELLLVAFMFILQSQKWRLVPALGVLAILTVVSGLIYLISRHKGSGQKRLVSAILACILCTGCICLSLMPALIFTDYSGLKVSGTYPIKQTSAILIDTSRVDPFEADDSFREVPVHFYYPEADQQASQFPLIVFSHGAFGYYQSNTSTYMELASNGYVVAALDHPHHAFFTEDTDGKIITVDQTFIKEAMETNDETTEHSAEVWYERYQRWMALRIADMNFVVDTLKNAKTKGIQDKNWHLKKNKDTITSMLAQTDITKIGLMGHSMGGATSVALGRERNDITAVIDIDGTMLSEYKGVKDGEYIINDEPYTVPVLEFNNYESYNQLPQYLAEGHRYPNDELMKHASQGISTTIKGTKHMDFTDLPIFSPFLGRMLGSGERDTKEVMMIVNSIILEFCDYHLKGKGELNIKDVY